MKNNKKPFVVMGSGGHAKVIIDLLECSGRKIYGVLNLDGIGGKCYNYPILGNDDFLNELDIKKYNVAIGIGFTTKNMNSRYKVYNFANKLGFEIPTLIHPSATVSKYAKLDEGSQILAGAIVGVESEVGINCIVNTGAKIDHDSKIGAHCHIAPGVTICGNVFVNENCFIGAGSTIIENISISKSIILGACSVVVNDIKKTGTYFGNPAKKK